MSRRKEGRKKGRGVYAECVNRDESGAEARMRGRGRKMGWMEGNTEFKHNGVPNGKSRIDLGLEKRCVKGHKKQVST